MLDADLAGRGQPEKLFRMSTRDYRRFMNFLAAHDCGVGFREFRGPVASSESLPGNGNVPLYAVAGDHQPVVIHI